MLIYIDMDGVIADFDKMMQQRTMSGKELKMVRGIYQELDVYPGAKEAITKLKNAGFTLHIATKIPDNNPYAATEKLLWLNEHFPELLPNVTITNNKGALGDRNSFIIDDRIHKANIPSFKGTVLHFGKDGFYKNWQDILDFFGVK